MSTPTPISFPTPDTRGQEYVNTTLDYNEREASLRQLVSALEFPPKGVVTIEWAEGVEDLQADFGQLIEEWQEVQPPPGFEDHHELYESMLRADLAEADAMFAWIGVGANREARQLRIDAYQKAVDDIGRLRRQANDALDAALSISATNPESVTLQGNSLALPELSIDGVTSRVTDQTETQWQYAWKVEARNLTQDSLEFAFRLTWTDSEGFVVDSANEFEVRLAPRESRTFTGAERINLPAAINVNGLVIEIIQISTDSP